MTTCEPSEELQYFLELQKQRNNNKKTKSGLAFKKVKKKKKTFRPPLLSIIISFSFFVHFEQF
jgi:hypothetical protein